MNESNELNLNMSEHTLELKVGIEAPRFCLPDKDNKEVCLEDFVFINSYDTNLLRKKGMNK